MSRAAVERVPMTEFTGMYPGHPVQVGRVRRDVHAHLDGHPASDDVVLIVSELATNAVVHVPCLGTTFEIHVETYPDYIWVECTDGGGDWVTNPPGDHGRGLVLVEMLAGGRDNWGTERTSSGSRIVWARVAAS